MERPFVSIIIPVRNAQRTIATTFEYLMAVDYPRDSLEMIFADGGSSDDTVKIIKDYMLKHPFIKLVEIPNCPSPGFARTKALKEAGGQYIFFTDGDCAPVKDWIDSILKVFAKDEKIGAVGGEIYTLQVDPKNLVESFCEGFGFNRVAWRYGNLQEGIVPDLNDLSPTQICGHRAYFFVTANVAYRKEAVEDAKKEFWSRPTGEDIDFGIRVRQKGWKFYFLPQASVKHMHRADIKALLKVWKSYGQAHGPLIKQHAAKHMEIIFQFLGQWPDLPILRFPFPIKGLIYIGNFHFLHFFALLTTIGAIGISGFSLHGWWSMFTAASLMFTLLFACKFSRSCVNMRPFGNGAAFFKMKYLSNLYFILGGLSSGANNQVVCLEPSF